MGMSWTVRQPSTRCSVASMMLFARSGSLAPMPHTSCKPLTILKGELEVALRASGVRRTISVTCVVPSRRWSDCQARGRSAAPLPAPTLVLRMDHTPVDLAQLVEEVCEQTRVLADAATVTLDLGPVEPMTVQGLAPPAVAAEPGG